MAPGPLSALLAAVMLAIAVYCAARLVAGSVLHRFVQRDVDLVHVGMGVSMAAMLAPRLNPLADGAWNLGWVVVFAAALVWFTGRAAWTRRTRGRARSAERHGLAHAVHSAAMLYMLLAVPATGAMTSRTTTPDTTMPDMTATGGGGVHAAFPALGLVLAFFMVGYAVLVLDRLVPEPLFEAGRVLTPDAPGRGSGAVLAVAPSRAPTDRRTRLLAPRSAAAYKTVMSLGMGYMLITML